MKRLILITSAVALLAACSAPKYTYYFDRYPTKSIAKDKEVIVDKSEHVAYEGKTDLPFEVIISDESTQDLGLLASASNNFSNPSANKNSIRAKNSETTLTKVTREDRKSLMKSVREFKAIKKSTDAVKGEKSKNGFAIAGFVSSLVGLIVLWPLCVVGLILSAIGLKSEKRGLAIAGLVIGIVGVVLVLSVGAPGRP